MQKDTDERPKSCNSSENVKDSKSRRVSILFNGIPMTNDPDTETHSNDSDANNTAEMVAEELVSAAISCRRASRRSSCRKLADEGLGSLLYPPNPFGFIGLHKAGRSGGRRSSFLSRRHSDGPLPPNHNQYHTDYELFKKNSGHYHCHRHHNHSK